MAKDTSLEWYVRQARKRGLPVTSSRKGGGWRNVANACGLYVEGMGRGQSRAALTAMFGEPPVGDVTARKPRVKRAPRPPREQPSVVVVTKRSSVGNVTGNDFLATYEWRRVRMAVLKRDGAKCMCCGATPATGAVMNVDHIKPRRIYPELALDENNLQVLCNECNHGKGNWDMTDWRPKEEKQSDGNAGTDRRYGDGRTESRAGAGAADREALDVASEREGRRVREGTERLAPEDQGSAGGDATAASRIAEGA